MNLTFDAKPVLKWAGGKQGLAARLITYFPNKIGAYYEPFIGGGSVLLTLHPEKAIIGDLNEWLLDTYVAIRTDHERVAMLLNGMVNTKDEYIRIRSISPDTLDVFQKAAHLIYLNKTCFRGLFRVNHKGQFNVPYGAYDRRYYDPDNLVMVAQTLKCVDIRYTDFELCLGDVGTGDFVYFDPPYYKQGGYSDFNRYTKFKFREHDHIRLASVCRELDERRGIRRALSNSDTPFVRALFHGYRMESIEARRHTTTIPYRSISELLILNLNYESRCTPLGSNG